MLTAESFYGTVVLTSICGPKDRWPQQKYYGGTQTGLSGSPKMRDSQSCGKTVRNFPMQRREQCASVVVESGDFPSEQGQSRALVR